MDKSAMTQDTVAKRSAPDAGGSTTGQNTGRTRARTPPLGFLFVATTLIGLLHVYIGYRLIPAITISAVATLAGAGLLVLSTALIPAGLLARVLIGRVHQRVVVILTWSGLLASGLASSLLVMTGLRDLLLLPAMALLAHDAYLRLTSATAWGALAIAAGMTLLGLINARRLPQVVEVSIPLTDLTSKLDGFRIAQISDIHVGATIEGDFLKRIVDRVNALNADMVAITGDLVDGSVHDLSIHTQVLADLRSRHGSFFVTGNHEYYSGAAAWVNELRQLGIKVLQNEHVVIQHHSTPLIVAGVTDFSAHHFDEHQRSDPHAAIAGAPTNAPKILLAHQPRSAALAAAAGFDLQLSGHTHGGQFWPWNYFVRLQQPYTAGLHRLDKLWVYTSRGTGYWGPPKRLGSPAEITLLRLTQQNNICNTRI